MCWWTRASAPAGLGEHVGERIEELPHFPVLVQPHRHQSRFHAVEQHEVGAEVGQPARPPGADRVVAEVEQPRPAAQVDHISHRGGVLNALLPQPPPQHSPGHLVVDDHDSLGTLVDRERAEERIAVGQRADHVGVQGGLAGAGRRGAQPHRPARRPHAVDAEPHRVLGFGEHLVERGDRRELDVGGRGGRDHRIAGVAGPFLLGGLEVGPVSQRGGVRPRQLRQRVNLELGEPETEEQLVTR